MSKQAKASPAGRGPIRYTESSGVSATVYAPLTIVTFDVAVSAEASDSTKSGAEVLVASSAERQTDLTRVQFCVRLLLPAGDGPKAKSETTSSRSYATSSHVTAASAGRVFTRGTPASP